VAGVFYLTNLAAPLVGFLVGRWSDRGSNRLLPFRICAVIGALGWALMAVADKVWMPFAISVFALSAAGAAMGQLFAAVRDELSRHPTLVDNQVISMVRMAFTAGYVVGPVLGSWFAEAFGYRPMLAATAACVLAQLLPLGTQKVLRYHHSGSTTTTSGPRAEPSIAPLLIFLGLTVLAMTGDTIKFGYLPIYMDQQLHLEPALRGAVIGLQPLAEFCLMPIAARLADRFSPLRVYPFGALFGIGAYLAYATSHSVVGLFAGQLMVAAEWACVAALGVSIAQNLYPTRVATASALFTSSTPVSGAIGGLIGGTVVSALGLPKVFFIPACFAVLGCLGLFVLSRSEHRILPRNRPAA
jgi:SET family sugar efflux transporter-like MFS transporter